MTYIYKCIKCETEREVSHSVDEIPEIICEHCEIKMRKKITAPSIKFKGSGFYVTDS